MTTQEWREAVEELRDEYRSAAEENRANSAKWKDSAGWRSHAAKTAEVAAAFNDCVADDLTTLLDRDTADRGEG
jgi:anti-sigma-K factor RskA